MRANEVKMSQTRDGKECSTYSHTSWLAGLRGASNMEQPTAKLKRHLTYPGQIQIFIKNTLILQCILKWSIDYYICHLQLLSTVEPVLKDHPIGPTNVVC